LITSASVRDQVDRLQRPILPDRHLLDHRVGDAADQIRTHVDAVDLLKVRADLAHCHPARVHRQDLVVESVEVALVLGDQLRLEAPVPIARDLDRDLTLTRTHGLLGLAVAAIALSLGRRLTGLVAQVLRQLRAHRPVDQSPRQVLEKAVRARHSG